jgi:hypothetical protein
MVRTTVHLIGHALTGLLLAATLIALPAPPASAGTGFACCICEGCADPPATQCFDEPQTNCEMLCSSLNCSSFSATGISCGQQPPCPSFSAPAPAPALAPMGLGLAAIILAILGRHALRRAR